MSAHMIRPTSLVIILSLFMKERKLLVLFNQFFSPIKKKSIYFFTVNEMNVILEKDSILTLGKKKKKSSHFSHFHIPFFIFLTKNKIF